MILDALLLSLVAVSVLLLIWAVNKRLDMQRRKRNPDYKGRERRLHRV